MFPFNPQFRRYLLILIVWLVLLPSSFSKQAISPFSQKELDDFPGRSYYLMQGFPLDSIIFDPGTCQIENVYHVGTFPHSMDLAELPNGDPAKNTDSERLQLIGGTVIFSPRPSIMSPPVSCYPFRYRFFNGGKYFAINEDISLAGRQDNIDRDDVFYRPEGFPIRRIEVYFSQILALNKVFQMDADTDDLEHLKAPDEANAAVEGGAYKTLTITSDTKDIYGYPKQKIHNSRFSQNKKFWAFEVLENSNTTGENAGVRKVVLYSPDGFPQERIEAFLMQPVFFNPVYAADITTEDIDALAPNVSTKLRGTHKEMKIDFFAGYLSLYNLEKPNDLLIISKSAIAKYRFYNNGNFLALEITGGKDGLSKEPSRILIYSPTGFPVDDFQKFFGHP